MNLGGENEAASHGPWHERSVTLCDIVTGNERNFPAPVFCHSDPLCPLSTTTTYNPSFKVQMASKAAQKRVRFVDKLLSESNNSLIILSSLPRNM